MYDSRVCDWCLVLERDDVTWLAKLGMGWLHVAMHGYGILGRASLGVGASLDPTPLSG